MTLLLNKYFEQIHKQIEFNQGKNIFLENGNASWKFIDEINESLNEIRALDNNSLDQLIVFTAEKALEEFCRINQYYAFSSQAKEELKLIYSELFATLKTDTYSLDIIGGNHYRRLQEWLQKTNPFAEKLYSNASSILSPVACSEYSPELQIQILKIDLKTLQEPVMDIGCGQHGELVNYLCKNGIEAYGIDRYPSNNSNRINIDWLEYNYGKARWGTLLSNLGFSNHFTHHHLREDGNYITYAKKYVELLGSLKIGGQFHYAPSLPFIESYLNREDFYVEEHEIESVSKMTIISRLK
jgi:hypothetical protein